MSDDDEYNEEEVHHETNKEVKTVTPPPEPQEPLPPQPHTEYSHSSRGYKRGVRSRGSRGGRGRRGHEGRGYYKNNTRDYYRENEYGGRHNKNEREGLISRTEKSIGYVGLLINRVVEESYGACSINISESTRII